MKISSKFLFLLLFGLSSAVFLWSCYPDSGLTSMGDYDLVLTQYDPDQDFSEFSTYILPDSIIHIVPEGEEDDVTREYDEQILERIEQNMNAFGYTKMVPAPGDTADVYLFVTATVTNWKGYAYYPGYGGWWGWWGYPGYPYYPGYAVPYTFSTGSVVIEWSDSDDYDPDEGRAPIRWGGVLNGLLDDSKTNIMYRLDRDIDQCFKQSPYLDQSN